MSKPEPSEVWDACYAQAEDLGDHCAEKHGISRRGGMSIPCPCCIAEAMEYLVWEFLGERDRAADVHDPVEEDVQEP
jgi:hypothetical protein